MGECRSPTFLVFCSLEGNITSFSYETTRKDQETNSQIPGWNKLCCCHPASVTVWDSVCCSFKRRLVSPWVCALQPLFTVPLPSFCRLYYLYNHWIMRTATYFFIFLDLSLAVFEEPAVYPLPFLVSLQCGSSVQLLSHCLVEQTKVSCLKLVVKGVKK